MLVTILGLLLLLVALVALGASRQTSSASARPSLSIVSPKAGAVVSGAVKVEARVPSRPRLDRVEFRVDGVLKWTERRPPWIMGGDAGRWKTAGVKVGRHRLTVTAVARNGRRTTVTRTVTVRRPAAPPPTGPSAPPPPAPAGLRAVAVAGNAITITWDAYAGAVSYGVILDGRRIGEVGTPGYTIGGLTCDVAHRVMVDALDGSGARSAKSVLDVRTAACPPPTVFLSPAGNDGFPCTAAQPCASLDRGYHAAAPGAVVELAGGSYPSGAITPDEAKAGATSRVLFRAAPGASVSISSELFIGGSHLELRGLALPGGWQTTAAAADVVMRDDDSKHFFIDSSQGVSIFGGKVGPYDGPVNYHPQIQAGNVPVPPRDILIDGVTFHDWRVAVQGQHTECLQIASGERVAVRNSRFLRCEATGNIHVTNYGLSNVTSDITIENNFFSTTINGFYAVQASARPNLLIRNNSATQGIYIYGQSGQGVDPNLNVRVIANVAPLKVYECVSGVKYSRNVWSDAKCGATDSVGAPAFINTGSLDLHISPASAAVGRGSATEGSEADIDGDPRSSGAPDAGADELP